MNPSLIALACLLLALCAWLHQRQGMAPAMWLAAGLLGTCLLAMTPLGANAMLRLLEEEPSAPAPCAQEAARPLVLLAGGLLSPARDADDLLALTTASTRRVMAAAASNLAKPGRAVFITGGGTPTSESAVMGALAVRLGLSASSITLEEASRNTWENAQQVRRLLPSANQKIVLITSALHMKRASLVFEQQGFDVCRFPVDSQYVPFNGFGYLIPQHSAVAKSEAVLHEILGMVAYRFHLYGRRHDGN